jgi:hypothetical protein
LSTPTSGDPGGDGTPGQVGPWASDNLPPHPMSYAAPMDMEQPPSIRLAVRLMWVGAALGLLGALLTLTQTDAIRDAVEDSDSSLTASEVDTVVNVIVASGMVIGLIGVGLWLWMASANGQGKSWARVVATVLGGLNIVGTLFGLTGPGATAASTGTALVGLALAIMILVLLYRPDSSRYYEFKSAERRRPIARPEPGQVSPARRNIDGGTPSSPAASIAARSTLTTSCSRSAHSSHGPGPIRSGSPVAAAHARR